MQKWADMLDHFRTLDPRGPTRARATARAKAPVLYPRPAQNRRSQRFPAALNITPSAYIRWHKGWQKPFPPLRDDKRLIPRQFACAIAPDPIAFLLPIGHQRAHLLRLSDVAAGKPIGSGALPSATTNWRGRFQPFLTLPDSSPQPCRYNIRSQLFARARSRAQRRASLTDRSLHQRREHSARHGGPPMLTNHQTILGTLSPPARACLCCKPTAADMSMSSA